MARIAIIGSGEFQQPLIERAVSMGYETFVFSLRNNTKGEKIATRFFDIDVRNVEEICEICHELKIDGIVSIASDVTTFAVNYVAEHLGLTGNTMESQQLSTNKYLMRQAFREAGLFTPRFCLVNSIESLNTEISELRYPLIIKPTDRAGSRGVIKIESPQELTDAFAYAQSNSFGGSVIIEEFIPGVEFSCECISDNGTHILLTLTEKDTTGAPFFVEIGHHQPARIANIPYIQHQVFMALDALKIKNGASHSEFKLLPSGELFIVEIGARMAGDHIGTLLVPLSTGVDYVQNVILIAMGEHPTIVPHNSQIRYHICFPTDEKDMQRYSELRNTGAIDHTNILDISEISGFNPLTNSGERRYWYIYHDVFDDRVLKCSIPFCNSM